MPFTTYWLQFDLQQGRCCLLKNNTENWYLCLSYSCFSWTDCCQFDAAPCIMAPPVQLLKLYKLAGRAEAACWKNCRKQIFVFFLLLFFLNWLLSIRCLHSNEERLAYNSLHSNFNKLPACSSDQVITVTDYWLVWTENLMPLSATLTLGNFQPQWSMPRGPVTLESCPHWDCWQCMHH